MRKHLLMLAVSMCAAHLAAAQSLDIHYIDTEGGQATLFIAPNGKTVLVDTGNAGTRDAMRIAEVAKSANVTQIDYLLITHYHGDHVGGYLELAKLLPIRNLVDHGMTVQPEQNIPAKQAYDAAIKSNPHIVAKPGDKLPIGGGVDWTVVSSAGQTLTKGLPGGRGAGAKNPWCATHKPKEVTADLENGQSLGSVITFGKFRTVDLGDLLWDWEAKLACPINVIGTVDLYLTTHHGMNWSGAPALVLAMQPRVAIMNNGTRKGGALETFQTLEASQGLENLWQLHWAVPGGLEHNAPGNFIANVETPATTADVIVNPPSAPAPGQRATVIGNPDHSPAYSIKVSARKDGSFTVTNTRNGFSKTYEARR